jgi:protein subunit release factor B
MKLLFSLTKKDFVMQTFRAGGKGGQNQNARDSAVRFIHPASGAVGESREHRNQIANKKAAFERMAASKEFKAWHRVEVARRLGHLRGIEDRVNEMMKDIKVEVLNEV